ncbi:MoxR family ATPase [bacterium]|nr:MoxR family ATPase [bacterium]
MEGTPPESALESGALRGGIAQRHPFLEQLLERCSPYIIGQDHLIERILVAMLCGGHVLLEGVPGLAKTRLLNVVGALLHCSLKRVQFTPDLLPADVIGTEIYQPATGTFRLRKGPVFANIVLADEINRAPAKVQSALLQAMQEKIVSIGEETHPLPHPFFVLATQNPIEQEGTYPLPEAQLDRFLFKVVVDYPSLQDEVEILRTVGNDVRDHPLPEACFSLEDLLELSEKSRTLYVDEKLDEYIVQLVQATRKPAEYGLGELVEWGASPRAGLALKRAGRALALLRHEEFVRPLHIQELAPDVLRHRILLSFEAEARGITADEVIARIVQGVPEP